MDDERTHHARPSRVLLMVGCYTNTSSVGIRTFTADDCELTPRHDLRSVEHASFLAVHPDGRTVYAVSESIDGAVVALRTGSSNGQLTEIDRVDSQGAAPCHVSVDADGSHVYVANYASGTVAASSLGPDGRFGEFVGRFQHQGSGPHPRQAGPHAHSVVPDPHGSTIYAVDLGLDEVRHYAHFGESDGPGMRTTGTTALEPGSGPRHITFHPRRPIAYVVCELDSTVIGFDVDRSTGRLHRRAGCSTLPVGFEGDSIAADVRVHPTGRTLYVSNRGHDSIAAFALGDDGDELAPLGHTPTGGRTPRSFAIHPSGDSMLVANQDSNTIVSIGIDRGSGELSGGTIVGEVAEPVCLAFVDAFTDDAP